MKSVQACTECTMHYRTLEIGTKKTSLFYIPYHTHQSQKSQKQRPSSVRPLSAAPTQNFCAIVLRRYRDRLADPKLYAFVCDTWIQNVRSNQQTIIILILHKARSTALAFSACKLYLL